MEEKEKIIEGDFLLDINDEKEIYVIESLKNKKRPVENQMRVYIKPLSGKDLAQIASLIRKDITTFQKEHPEDTRDFMELYNMFSEKWEFVYRIEKLENFKYKKDNEEHEITDPLTLYTFANSKLATIVGELRLKFMQMDMINVKNL